MIWQVCDDSVVLAWFAKDDYLKAAECLFKQASENALRPDMPAYQKKLELTYIQVIESEVKDYLGDTA